MAALPQLQSSAVFITNIDGENCCAKAITLKNQFGWIICGEQTSPVRGVASKFIVERQLMKAEASASTQSSKIRRPWRVPLA
jgi:hypothetical protein